MKMADGEIEVEEFLELAEENPVFDIRSPSEYAKGHISGAENLPLFSDSERARVGIKYKEEGRARAVLEGLKIVGPRLEQLAEKVIRSGGEQLLFYCWRGGMRSEAISWLTSLIGRKNFRLKGGYKAFRNFLLRSFERRQLIVLLGGYTGSGKTEILRELRKAGEQAIDLEGLAHHRGSAFGSLGMPAQPTQQQFENDFFSEWRKLEGNRVLWLENESRTIGRIAIPHPVWQKMELAPLISLVVPFEERVRRLVREYGEFEVDKLEDAILHIQKKLGPQNAKRAIEELRRGKLEGCTEILLRHYYDKTYEYGIRRRKGIVVELNTAGKTISQIAEELREMARELCREGSLSSV